MKLFKNSRWNIGIDHCPSGCKFVYLGWFGMFFPCGGHKG